MIKKSLPPFDVKDLTYLHSKLFVELVEKLKETTKYILGLQKSNEENKVCSIIAFILDL